MKKCLLSLFALAILFNSPVNSQGLLNKVKNAVSRELSGNNNSAGNSAAKTAPEPKCACNDATLVMDLGGKLSIAYNEMSVYTKDDGSLLVYDKIQNKYYVEKNGVTSGPYTSGDKIVKEYVNDNGDNADSGDGDSQKSDSWVTKYPNYISRSGDKYLIKFNGKNYGPYALISEFAVSTSKDKFAAMVTENVLTTEAEGKKLEEAMKNAKNDQERMELSMKYSQQMAQKMMQGGGTESITPKLVSNVPGAVYDQIQWMGGRLNDKAKYDDIVVVAPDKIIDLKGKVLMSLPYGTQTGENFFISSSNNRYANYNYGTLTFSDKTSLSELFAPHLTGKDGKVFLAYMYYSPGKNAIMQCLIPF